MPNETNILRDDNLKPEATREGKHVPMEKSPKLQAMLAAFRGMQDAVLQDRPLTRDELKAINEGFQEQRFVVGSRSFTTEELRRTPDFIRTEEILNEIEKGPLKNAQDVGNLTFLNDRATELLSKRKIKLGLKKVTEITDHQVSFLSKYKGSFLQLGVKSLNDTQAALLGKLKANHLSLSSLTSLNDNQAASLGKFEGTILDLGNLTSLTDAQAASLGQWKGKHLYLEGLEKVSDNQAASLGKWKGEFLNLNGLTSLTDDQANSFSQFKGDTLSLWGITKISKQGLQFLWRIKETVSMNDELEEAIEAAGSSSAS